MNKITNLTLCLVLGLCVHAQSRAAEDEYAGVRGKLETCFVCHGENGASTQPEFPILAGQHLNYLYVQLKDFKADRRSGLEMQQIVADLDREEMLAVAKFFSEQPWPDIAYRADPERAGKGEVATGAGMCVQCHLGGYEGTSGTPRVAGQHAAYLTKTMTDFKSKTRNNSPAKSSLMTTFSAEDIDGMAEFLAGM
jgi:cytochrome c553